MNYLLLLAEGSRFAGIESPLIRCCALFRNRDDIRAQLASSIAAFCPKGRPTWT
jgi:hypothetical protein